MTDPSMTVPVPIRVIAPVFGGGYRLWHIPGSSALAARIAVYSDYAPSPALIPHEIAVIGKRQIGFFDQNQVHAGQGCDVPRARVHLYAHLRGLPTMKNATMSTYMAFGERGRIFYRPALPQAVAGTVPQSGEH